MTPHDIVAFAFVSMGIGLACSGSGANLGPAQQTGQSCTQASQCYAAMDAATVRGQIACLTQLQNGYCTHTCQSDADCCAVPGECLNGFSQVCAPFESTAHMYCFLSCDSGAIVLAPDAGITDPNAFCQLWANPSFTCRSTGGGRANRLFCGP